jgi:hypothetical protein
MNNKPDSLAYRDYTFFDLEQMTENYGPYYFQQKNEYKFSGFFVP